MKDDEMIERLNEYLDESVRLLDRFAELIRDAGFNSHQNIRRIGEALAIVFDIQSEIYQVRPELTPEDLRK
jgi:hypothetical protein